MTTFQCPTCNKSWNEGITRDHVTHEQCRVCISAEVERLRDCVSPRYSIPLNEALGPLKPCPFCGSQSIGSNEGEVYCNNCEATNSTLAWQFRPPIA
jgi:hypothetical protein